MPGTMLRHRSSKGLRLPGTSGNYASTPDSVLNSVTGDLDVRVCFKSDTWQSGACLISKWSGSAAARSWTFIMSSTPNIPQFAAQDGSTLTTFFNNTSTSNSIWQAGVPIWWRTTIDVDNGTGSSVITMYDSIDGLVWRQFYTANSTGVHNINDSTTPVIIGAQDPGTSANFSGTIYYAEVRNGIDGPVVARFDSSQVSTSGSQVPSSINGWIWNGASLYKNDDYVRLPGTVANSVNFPDTPTNSVVGDLDVRIKLSMDLWNSGVERYIISKYNATGNQRSWVLGVGSTGNPTFYWSPDGTAFNNAAAGVFGFSAGQVKWIRVTFAVANRVATFYSSDDGLNWVNLGSSASGASTSLFDSSASVVIDGVNEGASNNFAGNVYYAEVRNGINGPVVSYFNAQDNMIQTPWTINGSTWNWEASNFSGKPGIAIKFDGTTGSYASTPDTVSNSVVGDMDLRIKAAPVSWSPGSSQTLIAKYQTATPLRSFEFRLEPGGGILFLGSADGTNTVSSASSALTGVSNGVAKWLRFTRIQSSGATAFFISDDGQVWTPVSGGTTVLAGTPLFDTTAPVEIGSIAGGASRNFIGTIYYAEMRSGIDGPIVAKFDPRNIAKQNRVGNILPANPSFESGIANWVTAGNVTLSQSSARALDGTFSLALTAIAAGSSGAQGFAGLAGVTGIIPGRSYTISGYMRAETIARNCIAVINWSQSNGSFISNSVSSNVPDTTSGWTKMSITATAPALSALLAVQFNVNDAGQGAGEVHYLDFVTVTENAFPPSTIQPGGTPNMLTPNQASLETDLTGWGGSGGSPTIARSTAKFLDGIASLSITSTVALSTQAVTAPFLPIVPGKLYTARANVQAGTVGLLNCKVQINWRDGAGALVGTTDGNNLVSTTSWQESVATGIAPSNAVQMSVKVLYDSATIGDVLFADRMSIYEAAEPWTLNGAAWDFVNTPETTISVGGGSRVLVEV